MEVRNVIGKSARGSDPSPANPALVIPDLFDVRSHACRRRPHRRTPGASVGRPRPGRRSADADHLRHHRLRQGKGFFRQESTKSDAGYRTIVLSGSPLGCCRPASWSPPTIPTTRSSPPGAAPGMSPNNVRRQWRQARAETTSDGLRAHVPLDRRHAHREGRHQERRRPARARHPRTARRRPVDQSIRSPQPQVEAGRLSRSCKRPAPTLHRCASINLVVSPDIWGRFKHS